MSALSAIEKEIAQAWLRAGVELGVDVQVDGQIDDVSEPPIRYAVRIPNFGRGLGTFCRHGDAPEAEVDRLKEWAMRAGASWSVLGDAYSAYDRDLFVETLNDWQWVGENQPPVWYSGMSHTR